MARLKPVTKILIGEPVEFPIICNSKGVFSTKFPAAIWGTIDVKTEWLTLKDLTDEIDRAVDAVNRTATIETDLIYYDIAKGLDRSLHSETTFRIKYVAVRRTQQGRQVKNRVIKRDVFGRKGDNNGLPKGWMLLGNTYQGDTGQLRLDKAKSIAFTPEAMQFLEGLEMKIQELADRMDAFLQPETVERLAATNQLPELINPAQATTTPTT